MPFDLKKKTNNCAAMKWNSRKPSNSPPTIGIGFCAPIQNLMLLMNILPVRKMGKVYHFDRHWSENSNHKQANDTLQRLISILAFVSFQHECQQLSALGFPHQSTMVTVGSVWRCHINWKSSIKFRTAHNRPEAVKVAFGISILQRWNVDVYNHQADIVRPRFLKQKKAYPYWAVKITLHLRQNLIFVEEMYEFYFTSGM